MRFNQWMVSGAFLLAASITMAESTHEQLRVPQCLAKHIHFSHQVLSEDKEFQIIDLESKQVETLSALADQIHCGRFVNMTHRKKQLRFKAALKKPSYIIKSPKMIKPILDRVSSNRLISNLTTLTSFYNRSANQKTGVAVAHWLKEQFLKTAEQYDRQDIDTYFVATSGYRQPSLVTVIGKDIDAPAVVVGAHMDTWDGFMPGADDDGSGAATLMEVTNVLLASKELPLNHPVYIIWYAAEERGLVGSQDVVADFIAKDIQVSGVAQFDMTGYRANPDNPTMWLNTDFTDPELTEFTADLITTFIGVPVGYTKCGYACSDHATWNEAGIPAIFPFEDSVDNPHIHTSTDTIDKLSSEHMHNFAKLAVAFAVTMSLAD